MPDKQINIKDAILTNGETKYKTIKNLLDDVKAPPWRAYAKDSEAQRNIKYIANKEDLEVVRAAIYLRRPLLITGSPGLGKSALAKALRDELELTLYHWQITSESTLKDALYSYDALGRLQDIQIKDKTEEKEKRDEIVTDIEKYLKLEALGSAFSTKAEDKPKVLLIDEIDKSDADLPNSLLHIFEEGYFEIPELKRLNKEKTTIKTQDGEDVEVENGKVVCERFPIVIMTSNGEKEFPPAFNRRCVHLHINPPTKKELVEIVKSNLNITIKEDDDLLELFHQKQKDLATDQLLNAVLLRSKGIIKEETLAELKENLLLKTLFKPINE